MALGGIRMLKVAIVEDELFMREFLENCISYDELGFNVCGSFCCAEDALLSLADEMPDLVITDIKMPGMDGVTFMSKMLEINPKTHFLVISNYQDFEIVRSAFRMGICDYIPKIDFEIERYKDTLEAFVRTKSEDIVASSLQNRNKTLKEQFWGENTNISANLSEQQMFFALFDILNYEEIVKSDWKMDKEQLKMSVTEFLEQWLEDADKTQFFFNEYDKLVILFSGVSIQDGKIVLAELRDFLQRKYRFIISVFLEETYTKLRNLKVKYAELYALRKFRFFIAKDRFITHNVVSTFSDLFEYTSSYVEMEKLFENKEYDIALERLAEIKQIKPAENCVEELMFFYQNIFLLVSGVSKQYDIDFVKVSSIKNLLDLSDVDYVSERLSDGIRKIAAQVYFPERKLNQQIDDYIKEHYSEKLTLEEMAKFFQYEYSYFSKMFRKLKGVTFRKYLNNFRLEKAEKLIRTTSLKYSEIAFEVGYQNYEHFSRSFRDKYGLWPNEIERMEENA